MSLSQQLTEFRFNLETLDLLNNMGKSSESVVQMLSELGFSTQLIKFMQSHRMLLNSVLLRLQLYSEQNMNEQKIRSNLAVLNNQSVHNLLDYLYKSTTKEVKKQTTPPPTPKVEEQPEDEEQVEVEDEEQVEEDEDENYFDSFFSTCVSVSDDATHVVKMSSMYDRFSNWWRNYSDDEVPSKDDLKEYLATKLGHSIKSTISNVSLL